MDLMSYIQNPFYQLILFVGISLLAIPLLKPQDLNDAWTYSGIIYVIFIFANSVCLFFPETAWRYFFISLLCSVVYLGAASLVVNIFGRLLKLEGSGESAMIFLSIIYHPPLLLLMIGVKWLFKS